MLLYKWLSEAQMKNLLLLVAVLAVCAIVGEVALRYFAIDPSQSYVRTPGWRMHVIVGDHVHGVDGNHTVSIGSLGSRTARPLPWVDRRIAVFGGSTVEDWALELPETWVARLETRLQGCGSDTWVGNFGKAGVNVRHHLLQLPAIEKYAPKFDQIIVLAGLNDFLYDYHVHHPIETPEAWWRQQALMYDGDQTEYTFASLLILQRLIENLTGDKSIPISDFGTYQASLRTAYEQVRDSQWRDRIQIDQTTLSRYGDAIASLASFASERDIPILFLTQPYIWSDDMSEAALSQISAGYIGQKNLGPDVSWYTHGALQSGLEAYNRKMLEICADENLQCFDLAASIARSSENFYDDFHFTELGADRVAEEVFQLLTRTRNLCEAG